MTPNMSAKEHQRLVSTACQVWGLIEAYLIANQPIEVLGAVDC